MDNKRAFSASAYVRKTTDLDIEKRLKTPHEYRDAMPAPGSRPQSLRVTSVDAGSVAARIGLRPGDEILELNGKPLLDVIDFQFKAGTIGRRMTLRTPERTVTFVRREWEPFGLEFEPVEPMVCKNNCVFCFTYQNPRRVRRSLRVKDEDYRLSFLFGNYLTLTNVAEAEITRIIDQRLSPLYISVHATEPGLRTRLLGNDAYDGLMEKIDRLVRGGITLHGQVVLCPGLNDGPHLERTIEDLLPNFPGVASLAIVPVGLTDHRKNLPELKPFTSDYAVDFIRDVSRMQRALKRSLGTPFAYLGDEIYIMAGVPVPRRAHYAEFPQIENGVGMVRHFLTQFHRGLGAYRRRKKPAGRVSGTVATGTVFHGYLSRAVAELGMDLRVAAVESRFWGKGIGVAGLLTGRDFVEALKGRVHGDFVVLPSESMIGDDHLFLDDLRLADVERELGVPVLPSGYDAGDFIRLVADRGTDPATST